MKKRNGNGRKDGTPTARVGYVLTEKGRAWLEEQNKKRAAAAPPTRMRAGMSVAFMLVAGLSGCGASKYAVAPADKANTEVTLGGEALISIKPSGEWVWRKEPEKVVEGLIAFANSMNAAAANCQAELTKLRPAPKPKPAAPPPAAPAPTVAPAKVAK